MPIVSLLRAYKIGLVKQADMPHTPPPTFRKPAAAALLATAGLVMTGCETVSSMVGNDERDANPAVAPGDFVQLATRAESSEPTRPANTDAGASDPEPSEQAGDDNTDPSSSAANTGNRRDADSEGDNAVSVNAMVGTINSEAVYADQIFDINLIAQLESFGRRFDGEQFRERANQAIQEKLRGVIINKLILGEAEMNLQERQRPAVEQRVTQEREELIRFYGQGSVSKARAQFRKERGQALDDYLTGFREELIVQVYIRSKVLPKISVSQINIENYYEDNKTKYHQPDRRAFRIIRVGEAQAADRAKKRLKRGEPFKDVASDPELNLYNPPNAGAFNSGEPLPGDTVYGIEPVNDALIQLKEGQHAGPIPAGDHFYFVQLTAFTPGKTIPLREAQLEIEETLRALAFEREVLRFRMDLLERGSYTDPEAMGEKLLDIATSRYDR